MFAPHKRNRDLVVLYGTRRGIRKPVHAEYNQNKTQRNKEVDARKILSLLPKLINFTIAFNYAYLESGSQPTAMGILLRRRFSTRSLTHPRGTTLGRDRSNNNNNHLRECIIPIAMGTYGRPGSRSRSTLWNN